MPRRRTAIIAGGSLIAGGLFATTQADTAEAQTEITLEEFSIPDTEESIDSVSSVPVEVDVRIEWESDGGETLEMDLLGGISESSATTLSTESFEIAQSGDDVFAISGDILTSADIDTQMLDPSINASVNLHIGLVCRLIGSGAVADESELWETARLTVTESGVEGSLTVGAKGTISVE
jgi:hypothetical protein